MNLDDFFMKVISGILFVLILLLLFIFGFAVFKNILILPITVIGILALFLLGCLFDRVFF